MLEQYAGYAKIATATLSDLSRVPALDPFAGCHQITPSRWISTLSGKYAKLREGDSLYSDRVCVQVNGNGMSRKRAIYITFEPPLLDSANPRVCIVRCRLARVL